MAPALPVIDTTRRMGMMQGLNRHSAKATPALRPKVGLLQQVFGVR
jgi:hypothetical protein